MRILLTILLLVSIAVSIGESYAQTSPNNIAMFVQIKVVDSNDNLVSYMECSKINIIDVERLNLLLNQNSPEFQKSIISNGQQKFEMIRVNDTVTHPSATVVSGNTLGALFGSHYVDLAIANHDGYPVVKGDKVTSYWTIIRPVS